MDTEIFTGEILAFAHGSTMRMIGAFLESHRICVFRIREGVFFFFFSRG
ncbi:unnamed protein product [Brassica rapa]|uniref:Uncharacterized protein n=1 Tax=Brassica campestris TaxID=3711 RepID=A0A8D9GVG5_BRACM|nr:unnamed protein product [Brassica rapa]